ncbi:MAG: 4-hydroxy-tetrahydrodipicolinate synthase [Planctomycetota bacterium]|jgi:4-hydroxy-tetrahydrodipicolinate synthase|nr:4-hydroxy-tetrahydrodipicolinate synthase [Planctomycetota bacterium]
MFRGSIVALVTPWKGDRVDEAAVKKLVEWHIEQGTDVIIPCGTTGESPAFSHEEQHAMIACTVQAAAGRVPVVAGAGSNNTREAVSLAKAAEQHGAQGILSVTPYYNKPTPEGLFQHYKAIGEACGLPVILYNVPGRTGCNMLADTCARIAESINVAAVKEASGDLDQVQRLLDLGLEVLSGDDALTLPMMCLGGTGVISVVANFAPRLMKDLVEAVRACDLATARVLHAKVWELAQVAFCETNPIPAKTACAALGFCTEEFRLPLVPMTEVNKARLLGAMKRHQLLGA